MGERALGWGLRLLSLALLVGPIFAAFAAHNWNLQAAVMPSQTEIDDVKEMLTGLFEEPSENTLVVENSTVDGTTLRTTVKFTSPFNIPAKITDLSGDMYCEQHNTRLGSVQIEEEEMEVQPRGVAIFTLVGVLTQEGSQHIQTEHGGDISALALKPENVSLEFVVYGISMSTV